MLVTAAALVWVGHFWVDDPREWQGMAVREREKYLKDLRSAYIPIIVLSFIASFLCLFIKYRLYRTRIDAFQGSLLRQL